MPLHGALFFSSNSPHGEVRFPQLTKRRDDKAIIQISKEEAELLRSKFNNLFIATTCKSKSGKRKKRYISEDVKYLKFLTENIAAKEICEKYERERNAWRRSSKRW